MICLNNYCVCNEKLTRSHERKVLQGNTLWHRIVRHDWEAARIQLAISKTSRPGFPSLRAVWEGAGALPARSDVHS